MGFIQFYYWEVIIYNLVRLGQLVLQNPFWFLGIIPVTLESKRQSSHCHSLTMCHTHQHTHSEIETELLTGPSLQGSHFCAHSVSHGSLALCSTNTPQDSLMCWAVCVCVCVRERES